MRDEERLGNSRESDLKVWRGIILGIAMGAAMWVGILWVAWELLF
jgi:hypothetical protein